MAAAVDKVHEQIDPKGEQQVRRRLWHSSTMRTCALTAAERLNPSAVVCHVHSCRTFSPAWRLTW
jgi:hypothetical protein